MDPEDVVRAFLEAESRFEPSAHFLAPSLRRLEHIVEQMNRAYQAVPEQRTLNVKRLHVTTQDDSSAVVDVDAFVVAHVSTKFGARSLDFRFRGPFSLRYDGTDWKVTGYTVDGIPYPAGVYDPIVHEERDGVGMTVGARLTKNGTLVGLEVDNQSDRDVLVSELRISFTAMWFFTARWAALHVPAQVAPGETWGDAVQWSGLSTRRRVTVTVRIDGRERQFALDPPRGVGPLRRRLRPLYGVEGIFYLVLVLAAISSGVTGSVGLLGIALAAPGAYALARASRAFVAGFSSSWAWCLALVGVLELGAAVVLMLRAGLGAIGTFVLVGTLGFALHQTVLHARQIRVERSRRALEFYEA